MEGTDKTGNRMEEESRMGRVWSLCRIELEIGSINLHTASRELTHTNMKKAATFPHPEEKKRCGATCVPARTAGCRGWSVCRLLVYFIRQKDTRAIIALHIGPLVAPKHHSGQSPAPQNNSRLLVPFVSACVCLCLRGRCRRVSLFIQYMHVFGCCFGCLYALVLDPAKDWIRSLIVRCPNTHCTTDMFSCQCRANDVDLLNFTFAS